MNDKRTLNLLRVDASGRYRGSVSRQLADDFVAQLTAGPGAVELTQRDLAEGMPFVDEQWIGANFTQSAERSEAHRATLAESDAMVRELREADVVIIGVPIYNFGVPAALKAWVDMVARAGETFRYTETGPEGLLEDKTVYLIATSGGTPVGSEVDFATRYMVHVLGFLGIADVRVISADCLMSRGDEAMAQARGQIERAVQELRDRQAA